MTQEAMDAGYAEGYEHAMSKAVRRIAELESDAAQVRTALDLLAKRLWFVGNADALVSQAINRLDEGQAWYKRWYDSNAEAEALRSQRDQARAEAAEYKIMAKHHKEAVAELEAALAEKDKALAEAREKLAKTEILLGREATWRCEADERVRDLEARLARLQQRYDHAVQDDQRERASKAESQSAELREKLAAAECDLASVADLIATELRENGESRDLMKADIGRIKMGVQLLADTINKKRREADATVQELTRIVKVIPALRELIHGTPDGSASGPAFCAKGVQGQCAVCALAEQAIAALANLPALSQREAAFDALRSFYKLYKNSGNWRQRGKDGCDGSQLELTISEATALERASDAADVALARLDAEEGK